MNSSVGAPAGALRRRAAASSSCATGSAVRRAHDSTVHGVMIRGSRMPSGAVSRGSRPALTTLDLHARRAADGDEAAGLVGQPREQIADDLLASVERIGVLRRVPDSRPSQGLFSSSSGGSSRVFSARDGLRKMNSPLFVGLSGHMPGVCLRAVASRGRRWSQCTDTTRRP